jgi:hypothetical protein
MQTDFAGRSLQGGMHEAYGQLVAKVSEGYSEEQVASYTKAEDVAKIIYDAATDDKEQLRYIAGNDAVGLYNERLELSPEGQFKKIRASLYSNLFMVLSAFYLVEKEYLLRRYPNLYYEKTAGHIQLLIPIA